jgi:hypothetical protein
LLFSKQLTYAGDVYILARLKGATINDGCVFPFGADLVKLQELLC